MNMNHECTIFTTNSLNPQRIVTLRLPRPLPGLWCSPEQLQSLHRSSEFVLGTWAQRRRRLQGGWLGGWLGVHDGSYASGGVMTSQAFCGRRDLTGLSILFTPESEWFNTMVMSAMAMCYSLVWWEDLQESVEPTVTGFSRRISYHF